MSRSRAGTAYRREVVAGYSLLASDGGLFNFGVTPSLARPPKNLGPWVDFAASADGRFAVAATGAGRLHAMNGSLSDGESVTSSAPIVAVEVSSVGDGFWVLDAAGGVFCFGDAGYFGSLPGLSPPPPSAPVVGMASTSSSNGYWILDQAGGVYCFGDAEFFGSVPALRLDAPPASAVAIVASPTGEGYSILERDGCVRGFGDGAGGSIVCDGRSVNAVAFARAADPAAFVAVDRRGFVYPVGTAPMLGSTAGIRLDAEVVEIVCFTSPA